MKRKKMIFKVALYVPADHMTAIRDVTERVARALDPVCRRLGPKTEDNGLLYGAAEYMHTDESIEE